MPIFLAPLSFHLHLSFKWSFISFCLVLILTAIFSKLKGCGLGAMIFKYNMRESSIIGLGMNGRGAVELVVATVLLGLSEDLMLANLISEPLLTQDQFTALILIATQKIFRER